MANVFVNEDSLTDIADAIREKLSVQTTYKPSEMAAAIESISGGSVNNQNKTVHPSSSDQSITADTGYTGLGTVSVKAVTMSNLSASNIVEGVTVKIGDADDDDRIASVTGSASGGITPTGTKEITSNGTNIDVYSYAKADVSVPNSYSASDEGKVVSNGALVAQTSDTVTTNDTYDTTLINSLTVNVSGGGGGGYTVDDFLLKTISGAITTSMVEYAGTTLDGFAGITSFNAPALTNLYNANYMFRNCTSLATVNMPLLQKLYGANMFSGTAITSLVLPSLGNDSYTVNQVIITSNTFLNCASLKSLDVYSALRIDANAFKDAALFDTLIIRQVHSGKNVTLNNISAFDGTPFASGGTGGTIYVPSSYVSTIQSATNWSTIIGYANNQVKAIEGSYYATHYADGTSIS